MGKVKEAIYEIQEEIQEIIYFWKGDSFKNESPF